MQYTFFTNLKIFFKWVLSKETTKDAPQPVSSQYYHSNLCKRRNDVFRNHCERTSEHGAEAERA